MSKFNKRLSESDPMHPLYNPFRELDPERVREFNIRLRGERPKAPPLQTRSESSIGGQIGGIVFFFLIFLVGISFIMSGFKF